MRIAVVSPHVDDAVFSVGEHMLSRPDDQFTVICPCGAKPATEPHRSKYEILLMEHVMAMTRGGWEFKNGYFVDDAAVTEDETGTHCLELVRWLADVLQASSADAFRDVFDEWWVPFGVHHPDHRHVRTALGLIARPAARTAFYEELPYRVLYPEEAVQLRTNSHVSEMVGFGPLGEQPEAKRRMCGIYASQVGPDIERSLYVPERLWR